MEPSIREIALALAANLLIGTTVPAEAWASEYLHAYAKRYSLDVRTKAIQRLIDSKPTLD